MVYADDKYPRLMPTRPHATDNLKEDKEDTRGEREREERERKNPKPYWGDGRAPSAGEWSATLVGCLRGRRNRKKGGASAPRRPQGASSRRMRVWSARRRGREAASRVDACERMHAHVCSGCQRTKAGSCGQHACAQFIRSLNECDYSWLSCMHVRQRRRYDEGRTSPPSSSSLSLVDVQAEPKVPINKCTMPPLSNVFFLLKPCRRSSPIH